MLFYINSGFETISNSNRRLAIVSIAVGDTYIKTWTELCKASWEQYAETVSADIIVIVGAIDKSDRANARSVAWQKLLILDQPWAKQYDKSCGWIPTSSFLEMRRIFFLMLRKRKKSEFAWPEADCRILKPSYFMKKVLGFS